ncbi:GH11412 [Drosophila grimshawi]|uniref:GH11412 n=1 Tax=Drosophila grimshawi TaxID=7222 RepID=B4JA85_DROGR|nr:GH11412 [Drosophila grimshawi]
MPNPHTRPQQNDVLCASFNSQQQHQQQQQREQHEQQQQQQQQQQRPESNRDITPEKSGCAV